MDYSDIDRRLKALIDRPASNHLLSHISHQASLVIPCHHTSEQYKSPIPPLATFVNLLAKRSCARTGTLLASLVLLDRLRQRLAQFAKGMPCTCQRIFLATLIVTTKILHDTSPKNKHWTKYAVYFTLPEVNLMEKQLLALMNYQLVITEKDMYYSFITYDNTTILQLPPILSFSLADRDRNYLPKSATFNSPSSYRNNNHNSLSNIILQQQQQQHHHHQLQHYYNNNKKSTTATAKRNTKRLYISTSSSSLSSLSSSNSMDDILVVTPTNNDNNSVIPIMSTNSNTSKKQFHLNTNNTSNNNIMWLDPIILPPNNSNNCHLYSHHNILFKN